MARLDLLNLTLTQQKRQAVAALNFIKIMQEEVEKAITIDDLYSNVVKALTDDLFMDSSALLGINFKTREISLLASSGLPENLKCLKLNENVSKHEILEPTFVNSKSSLQSFHTFVIDSFQSPYFVWHPIADEEDGTLILFVGNRVEDLMSKQPFSQVSLETFGAISSVILLRRNNIANILEMLRRKEERIDFLAEILKTSPISVIATDVNARITYCNPAAENLYGYKAEELTGKDPGILNAEPNAGEIQKEITDTVRQRKVWKGEILNRKKNGDLFYIHASIYPVLDKESNFIAFAGFYEDITEHKQAEKALIESEKKYRNLVNNALVGIYKTNLKGDILYVNEALRRMLEFESIEEVFAGSVVPKYKNIDDRKVLIENLMKRNKVESFEVELLTKMGKVKDVLISATLDGDILSGMVIDITEHRRAEEKLRRSREQLRALSARLNEAEEAMRQRLAQELHDQIGQNLTALGINLHIMQSHFSEQLDKKTTSRLEDSMKLVEETIESIRNMLVELRPPVLDDYGLLVALRWYSERFSERARVSTILQGEELTPRLLPAVEMALFRIFQEVLTNVAKHARARRVNITLKKVNRMVELTISDDGIGFDPTEKRQLKEKIGWGLITIEERAKALGGSLYVESAPGKGTQVIVQLPCSKCQ